MATLASLVASAGESGTVVYADTERKFSGQRCGGLAWLLLLLLLLVQGPVWRP